MDEFSLADQNLLHDCTHFLVAEAEALDRGEFERWLAMLSCRIDYAVPVRVVHDRGHDFSGDAFFMKEDHGSLSLRVKRLASTFSWAEHPPTRTRRLVSNVRLSTPQARQNDAHERVAVSSNFAVFCYRGDVTAPTILTGERRDVLVREDDRLKLAERVVLLDSTVIGLGSLSIFL